MTLLQVLLNNELFQYSSIIYWSLSEQNIIIIINSDRSLPPYVTASVPRVTLCGEGSEQICRDSLTSNCYTLRCSE